MKIGTASIMTLALLSIAASTASAQVVSPPDGDAGEAARAQACATFEQLYAAERAGTAEEQRQLSEASDHCIALGGSAPAYFHRFQGSARTATEREADIGTAVQLAPDNPVYLYARGLVTAEHYFSNRIDAADRSMPTGGIDIDRALQLDERRRAIRWVALLNHRALDALLADGRHEAIVRLMDRRIANGPADGPRSAWLEIRGMALLTLGRTDAALADLSLAGERLQSEQRGEIAAGDWLSREVRNERFRSLFVTRGLAFTRAGQNIQAMLTLSTGLSMTGPANSFSGARTIGTVLALCRATIEADRVTEALTICESVSDRRPGLHRLPDLPELQPVASAYRGLAFERRGARDRARRAYRAVLAADRTHQSEDQVTIYLRQDAFALAEDGLARLGRR